MRALKPIARMGGLRPFGLFIAAEAAGIAAATAGLIDGASLLIGHALCLVGAAAAVRAERSGECTFAVLLLLLAACTGPIGPAGLLLVQSVLTRTRICTNELDAWYRRLAGDAPADPSVILYDRLLDGRARRTARGGPDHFPTVLHGDLVRQQALLGLIGLAYHPDYRPILAQALCSQEPSIRVHAAAVSVKLRARALAEFKRAQETRADGPAAERSGLALRLLDLADGGFLDAERARAARTRALALVVGANPPDAAAHDPIGRRALAGLERWEAAVADPEAAGPARDPEDLRLRMLCLMQCGQARALHALLSAGNPHDPTRRGGLRHVA
ncbi:hypothetical protein [Methylobacterium gregans]|uniref:Uncharacterized protein n=1 Tax=Methylobacterium gregans TaxID=374424 RepID=A0AA37ME58_9HYPH|nr:hypothetical protein [Methylobacterium gregans]MDQ0523182.1 hypothetical protein [Methylobacterium gregans]GJD80763.1 hypothetical protein NBEOAGPD_4006 [Methylobacterium gregans]GLS53599.1 hypothetical protein GCM10007886_17820 [Methylobacterium gregans]